MKRLSLLAAALLAVPVFAQDDFSLWTEVAVQKDLGKNFSVDAGVEYRMEDNVSQPARWAFSTGASYKPLKYFSIGVGYVFLHDYNFQESEIDYKKDDDGVETDEFNGYNVDHAYWRNKHRATLDLTGKLPLGRFTISLRERYQYTHYVETSTLRDKYRKLIPEEQLGGWTGDRYDYAGQVFSKWEQEEKLKRAKNRHYLRSRLGVEYNIKHCAWTPYASYELSNNLSESFHLDKKRLTLGAEWKITKQHRLDFAYVYDNGADDDARSNDHAISLSYKFKF